ncbi:MAG: glycine betaine ABC transporter substrate-binding protein [bacterium]
MIKKVFSIIFMVLFLNVLFLSPKVYPCVGRLLFLGITASEDQKVMAEVLSILISECTGTQVNIVTFQTLDECREAVQKEELDLYFDYVGSGLFYVLNHEKKHLENPDRAYSFVKHVFDQKFSLIWLKPFGYTLPMLEPEVPEEIKGIPNQAVCVARRQVLNRFPVLPRLINKLRDRVPHDTIEKLQKSNNLKSEARAFLESENLIRWLIPN